LLAAVGGDVDLEGGCGAGEFADAGQGFAGAQVAALDGGEAAFPMVDAGLGNGCVYDEAVLPSYEIHVQRAEDDLLDEEALQGRGNRVAQVLLHGMPTACERLDKVGAGVQPLDQGPGGNSSQITVNAPEVRVAVEHFAQGLDVSRRGILLVDALDQLEKLADYKTIELG